jgi:hypothetical protein
MEFLKENKVNDLSINENSKLDTKVKSIYYYLIVQLKHMKQ